MNPTSFVLFCIFVGIVTWCYIHVMAFITKWNLHRDQLSRARWMEENYNEDNHG
jgi:hypothetical protein